MFWQHEYEREASAMTLPSTFQLDLPENGLLGSILLRFTGTQAMGYGQGAADWRIIDKLTKFVILANGATIIKSLTGLQAQALSVLDQGVMPPSVWQNYATNMQTEYVLINFGRKLYDRDYGLDLARFKNIELQITNDAAAASFSDITVSIMAIYLRDAPAGNFKGYMRSEEWRSWTTVMDETKYLDLPTEHILRRVLFQAIPELDADFVGKTGMNNLMDDIEFSLDTGVMRVHKGGIDDLMRMNYYDLGAVLFATGSAYQLADDGIDISLGFVLGGAWGSGSQDGAVAATNTTLETGRDSYTQKSETYEVDHPVGFLFAGITPFLCAQIRFDYDPDPATWLDPNARKTVECNIHTRSHADADAGRNAVVLDRLVRY